MKSIPFVEPLSITPAQKTLLAAVFLPVFFALFVWGVYNILPVHLDPNPPETWGFAVDWKGNIRPSVLRLLSGQTPYATNNCFPPWAYLLLAPIALLPPAVGAAVMFALTYLGYMFAFLRLGAKPLQILGLLLCPFVYINAQNGNIDFLPVLGMVLPPQIGLFFVLMKPQLGAGIALYWLVEAWRTGRTREVVRVFGPVALAYLASFAFFGLWPLRLSKMPNDAFNASLWPMALPIGLGLLAQALRSRNKLLSISATPFLAPYINLHSYAILLFAFLPSPTLFYIAIALSWLVVG
jgi:hypothetical protein